eukprot:CAMPEP_0198238246 /NCGR_PEP_ID=MMETSP1446-20131203/3950_1 /TAXON_ID=1461542 ORGANISM="Unidentified sp, Strain CCMP2111" /NCGR_SAMPLE_ID=MMETSP1446 /ASSEMBLY_ACC=CAM_ASM_001112 /LENGTH=127 /DNA_ID=CAMNT_0043920629 /DNA_START=120 /DNA_END=500 /DNA_ORIENTATION=-
MVERSVNLETAAEESAKQGAASSAKPTRAIRQPEYACCARPEYMNDTKDDDLGASPSCHLLPEMGGGDDDFGGDSRKERGDHASSSGSGSSSWRRSPSWGVALNAVIYMAAPMSMPATMAAAGFSWG